MDELLTPISTTYRKGAPIQEALLTEVKSTAKTARGLTPQKISVIETVTSHAEAIDVIKSQPEYDALIAALRYLVGEGQNGSKTNSTPPLVASSKTATIIQLLMHEIVPNYWPLLLEGALGDSGNVQVEDDSTTLPADAILLARCFRNATGLNALVARIRILTSELKNSRPKRPDLELNLGLLLDLLAAVLHGNAVLEQVAFIATSGYSSNTQASMFISEFANGRLQTAAAEASEYVDQAKLRPWASWVFDGQSYCQWIGRNILQWAKNAAEKGGDMSLVSEMFRRSLSLGHHHHVAITIIDGLLLSLPSDPATFSQVCLEQAPSAKKMLHILLKTLSERFLNNLELENIKPDTTVSAVAGLLKAITGTRDVVQRILVSWSASLTGAGLGDGVGVRRAMIAVLAQDKDRLIPMFEQLLSQFGDELYIKHTPILQQDVHAQVLLLCAGYVHRMAPMKLMLIVRTPTYLSAISNRIAATQPRAQFLGLVIGESFSKLVLGDRQSLDFHMEETGTEEAKWYKGLTQTMDEIGPTTSLLKSPPTVQKKPVTKPQPGPWQPPAQVPKIKKKIVPMIEVLDEKYNPAEDDALYEGLPEEADYWNEDEESEDDDLVPYAKAFEDPEDSDDDPTLVQRNKVRAPVYVRTLIEYLRDSENYDKQKLALQTAPGLLRRKADYGTEVSAHAVELAGLIVGVQDKFEIEGYHDLKLQGMIALIVAQPKTMAPWFSRTFFEGDYSLSQRTSVLVAIGLSARELAGFDISQYKATSAFPSKRLPGKVEHYYLNSSSAESQTPSPSQLKALPTTAIHQIANSLTKSFLAPMAAEAADASTGPDALKFETFKARYKSQTKSKPRVRAIPNTTASILATHFFYPLTAHFTVALRSSKPLILNPSLLALYLQTLGIIIHAAGPSTLSLPQLTSELWDLLLSVRTHVLHDVGATRGWLVAMAALLEVNEGDMRRVCESMGREIVETREWVGVVFERTRGGDGGEENDVKMMAAGVLIKIGEAMEQYQALLMGNMIGFT